MELLTDSGRMTSRLCFGRNRRRAAESMMHIDKSVYKRSVFSAGSERLRSRVEEEIRSPAGALKPVLACLTTGLRCCFPADWQWMKDSKRSAADPTRREHSVLASTMDNKRSEADELRRPELVSTMEEQKSAVKSATLSATCLRVEANKCRMEFAGRWLESALAVDRARSMVANTLHQVANCAE